MNASLRRRAPSRSWRSAAAALICGSLIALPAPSRAIDLIELIGTFKPTTTSPNYIEVESIPYASRLRLQVDEITRRLWTIDDLSPSFAAAYDLDTLAPIGEGIPLAGSRHVAAVLPDGAGVLAATGDQGTSKFELLRSSPTGVERVGSVSVDASGLGGPSHVAVALAPVRGAPLVFAMSTTGTSGSGGTVNLSLINLDGIESGNGSVLWTQALPSCLNPVRTSKLPAALGWVAETSSVYFPCADASTVLFDDSAKAPTPAGVGRLHVANTDGAPADWQAGTFELYPKAADFRGNLATFDPVTKRVLLSGGGATEGGTLYAFDTIHNAYVGGLTIGPNALSAIGISASAGRVYARAPNTNYGLLAADVATTPLEQGRAFGEYGGAIGGDGGGSGQIQMIAVDGATQRVFMPPTTRLDGTGGFTPYWFVLLDHAPAYEAPAPTDPDVNTVDIPELPGKTGRTFNGAAQGYGFRTRQVGGTSGLQYNVVPFNVGNDVVVSSGTREARGAYLERITLSSGEAAADAISSDRDQSATGADQGKTGTEWPFAHAQCVDFGDGKTGQSIDNSSVSCDLGALDVTAETIGDSSSANGVGASGSSVSAEVRIDDELGVVVEVTAQADGIGVLDGAMTIGKVTVTTAAHAHGRPGTAGATFDRTVEDVTIAGQIVCGADCDIDAIAAQFNETFAGRARIDFPNPDERLLAGSPGGYEAIAQRGYEQQIQAIFEDEQEASRTEVPGMVLYVYQDNSVPAHTVYEFAGTQAEARYGIYPLVRGTSDGDGSSGGVAPPPPPTPTPTPTATSRDRLQLPLDGPPRASTIERSTPVAARAGSQLRTVIEEVRALLLNKPWMIATMFSVWALLLAPIYLSARRSLYLRRDRLVPGGAP